MASTSAPSGLTESEPATTSQGLAQSSSSSSPSSSRSLFSCCLFPSRRSAESKSMPSTSDTTGCIPQNEASTSYNPMASSSVTSGGTESELATTSQAMAPSSSSFSPSPSPSLFSSCFFSSRRSMESNPMASTSNNTGCILQNEAFREMAAPVTTSNTTSCIPQNEVFQERAPPATVSASSGYTPENESFQEMARSASTSGSSGCIPENEVMGASQEMTPSTSTSGIPQDEVSTPSGRTESEPATTSQGVAQSTSNSTGCILQNEAFQEIAPPVTPQNEEFQEMAPPATASDTTCYIPENESIQEMAPSASTSGASGCIPEGEIMGASQEMTPPASTSGIPQNEAFQGMAPSASDMCRSSTLIQKPCYDVFINHRGPDVKEILASKIYNILCDMKVPTFLDSEELDYGDFFPETLQAAIHGATLHIAIFSKRYAESAWCLEELSVMLRSGAKIIPIFYHVDPTDLRHVAQRKGKYVAAFNKHEEERRYKTEKLEEWKDALYKVSFYTGEIIKNNDYERLFKNIVNIVLKEIRNVPLVVAKHPVGLNEIVKDFENTVQLDNGNQGMQIVGIWGMGGSGKTTLAKKLFNQRSLLMERSSFIFDIRADKGLLQKKQSELLKGLGVNETIDSVEQGQAILARHLRSFRVLIVMDDVDHVDQLDALLPTKDSLLKDNLGKGSVIIVTTREYQVLTSWGISSVYKMRALDQFNAKQLFCWHAFLQPSPFDGFQEFVEKFIKICDGLPLSLKVFGAQLYGNSSKKSWRALLHRISRILPEDIKKRLKISYDALQNEEKEAFLDIACFFIGEEISLAIEVWDGSDWSGLYTWETLLNKCLFEVGHDNHIRMHDHLRDLGREIANQHSPSRIWLPKQIIDFGKQIEKTSSIRGIKVAKDGIKELFSYREALAPYLVGLKLLVFEGDYSIREIGDVSMELVQISTELVWLRWRDFGQRNLTGLSLKNLRILQLKGSDCLEELWEAESDAPVQLRELIISDCPYFQGFPNSIGCLRELKKIVVKGYRRNVVESLPEGFCRLQLLEHLNLESCRKLSSLPSNFGNLRNLRYLDLSECGELRRLPDSFKNLTLLRYLRLYGCSELILEADDFQNITNLEFLNLDGCEKVKELPRHITNQVSLKVFYLCGGLKELPTEIGQLGKLQNLALQGPELISLPNSLGDLTSLTSLEIRVCDNLESLPTSLGVLSSLISLRIMNCPKLKSLPTSLGDLSSLISLIIYHCKNLESLPTSLGDLSSLTSLKIFHCNNLESLPTSLGDLSSLTSLRTSNCPKLKCLDSAWRRSRLEHLEISSCPIIQVDFEAAPSSSALSNLKRVTISGTEVCSVSIPDRYPQLESLELWGNDHLTEIKALPVKLECLDIRGNRKLVELPSFARLTSLREFKLRDWDRIEKIEGLEQMERLKRVELRANKGSAIVSCIETMQKWPDEILICTRAVADVSALLDSFKLGLSPNLSVSEPVKDLPDLSSSSFVIYILEKCLDSEWGGKIFGMEIGEGKWALIALCSERLRATIGSLGHRGQRGHRVNVVRSLAVSGEQQRIVEAFSPLLQTISM